MSKEYFNKIAEDWDDKVNHDKKIIEEDVIDSLPDFKRPNILDVGAGTGVLIPFLINKYGKKSSITELDFAENMLQQAQKKYKKYNNIEYVSQNIYDFSLDNQFDIIFCYSVFPHFSSKKKILKKLKKGLTTNGIIVIFHSQSRKEINQLHQKKDKPVKKDKLPPVSRVIDIGLKHGLQSKRFIDNKKFYLLILENIN